MNIIDRVALVTEARDEMAGWPIGSGYYKSQLGTAEAYVLAEAVLPVITKRVFVGVRELHRPIIVSTFPGSGEQWDECEECLGQEWPCRTVRLLNATEAAVLP